ncbi:type II toxin-antitoxin system VapC family toxin [Gracilimonas mengyeensis]|uniref:PIN domain-containing protein n=1 Tax=Gracilimonas mengyeensis TaxID=1302730 RepID=A0A521BDF0_9BACT|nr:type II toxin-antitoxin system VapC family toxin [Gracilimonas mengyeensis]SMO45089.1 hypothetical protein SAMN06265219_102206 [Gracilimonas mengyeensis]
MGESGFLIDSNAVIDYLGNNLPNYGMNFMNEVIDQIPNLSVITKIEVLGYNAPPKHYSILSEFMNDSNILELSEEVVNHCIEIRKTYSIKLPDAIIAATALTHDLSLITRNMQDFEKIPELNILNPHLNL